MNNNRLIDSNDIKFKILLKREIFVKSVNKIEKEKEKFELINNINALRTHY